MGGAIEAQVSTPASTEGIVPPLAAAETSRFLLLDGLRGVAALAVVFDHVPPNAIGDLIPQRYLAVDFFFVLSGFVLAHAYGPRLAASWPPLSFMRVRLIRLYPLYLAGSLIGFSVAALGAIRGWGGDLSEVLVTAAFGVFFLPTLLNMNSIGVLYPLNGPAWSLFFELVANFFYALIARFLSGRMLALILSVSAVLLSIALFNHADVRGPGWQWSHFDAGLARVVFDFFVGVAIYRLWSSVGIPALPWWAAVMAFFAIIAFPVGKDWAIAYDAIGAIILMPLLVAVSAGSKAPKRIAAVCGVFGMLSYGIYILHVPILASLQPILAILHIDLDGTWMMAALVAGLAAAAAAIADGHYDRPFRNWLDEVLPGHTKRKKKHSVTDEQG